MAKKNAAAMLKDIKGAATKKTSAKPDTRPVWIYDPKKHQDIVDLIQLSTITNQLDSSKVEHDKSVKQQLLERFCEDWWAAKQMPQNPRIIIRKHDSNDQPTAMDDMSFMFMVKFAKTALTNVLPNAEQLPADKTAEDVLLDMIQVSVGLSQKNALALLNEDDGEISVQDKLMFANDIDSLLENEATSKAATKLIAFLQGEKKVQPLTDEEKGSLLVTAQVVTLKEGFFERAHQYVDNAEQLLKLIKFVKATLQISSYEFAISDTPADKTKRLEQVAIRYLANED